MARKNAKTIANGQQALPSDCTAGYIRVSTDKQVEEGYSLEAQAERIKAYCQAQGWRLCDEHIYTDAGITGKSTDRPQFQAMLEAAQRGAIKRLVTVKLDRVARNTRDFLATVDTLQKVGCELVLIKEAFDTSTPHGKFALTLFAAMAELEVSMIQERTMSGRVQKASKAGHNGSPTAYGYNYDGQTFNPNDNALFVRRIFDDFLSGSTVRAIADKLNTDKVPTANGGKWYASTVSYVLHNGFYAGLVQYDGQEVRGKHEPLITVEQYEQAQAMLGKRGPAPKK
jgi:site-specific DNA recombinase